MAQHINLFDPALSRRRDWLALSNLVVLAVLLMTGIGVAGVWAGYQVPTLAAQATANEARLKAMRDQVLALGQQVESRKPDARLERDLAEARRRLATRNEVLATLQQRLGPGAASFADYLRGYARQSVAGLWLTGVTVDTASGGMEIRGRTVDPALLPEYIRRLDKEPAFQGRAFGALKLAEGKVEPLPGVTAAGNASPEVAKKAQFHEFALTPVGPATARQTAGRPG